MKRFGFLFHPVLIFVSAQLAWLSLLGIWIYWYVSNYIIFTTVEDKISPQLINKQAYLIALITGIVLLVTILVGIYLIFIYLTRQLKLTDLYDNFIANITHELKSPLASIQLHLDTLMLRDIPRHQQQQFLALMQKDADRLKQLINTILEIAALEQKRIAYDFQIYQADTLVKDILAESMEQFQLEAGQVHLRGQAGCQCVADRGALKIVFDNLIDNAIKYSEAPVRIQMTLSHHGNRWYIRFRDHGIGLARLDQKKIFQKFMRVYRREIPTVKGTGLGLYWVNQIIKYHGGTVTASSDGPGTGTLFTVTLPVYPAAKRRYMENLLKLTRLRRQVMNSENKH